jgi:hypothetical protein
MRRRLSAFVVCLGLLVAPAATTASTHHAHHPAAVAAKTCSRGYTHAVIGGQQKCLRAGEYCSRSHKRQYPKYGYACTKRDRNGRYHLVRL